MAKDLNLIIKVIEFVNKIFYNEKFRGNILVANCHQNMLVTNFDDNLSCKLLSIFDDKMVTNNYKKIVG